MTTPPDASDGFRQRSTRFFRGFVVCLALLSLGIAAASWWIGRWWGLVGGTAIGAMVFVGGVIAGTLMWAMTQDGG